MTRITPGIAEHLPNLLITEHERNPAPFRAIGVLCYANGERKEFVKSLPPSASRISTIRTLK